MRVAVYGNIIYDTIINLNEKLKIGSSHTCTKTTRIGGIGNFYRAATQLFDDVVVVSAVGCDTLGHEIKATFTNVRMITNVPTTTAYVLNDRQSSERTGIVEWGACRDFADWEPVHGVDWHHFMYLDKMRITAAQLEKCEGRKSADFCNPIDHILHQPLLEQLDYIISSVELMNNAALKYNCVEHCSLYSQYLIDNEMQRHYNSVEPGLNVLGAGDYFAACCIANLMKERYPNLNEISSQVLNLLRAQS